MTVAIAVCVLAVVVAALLFGRRPAAALGRWWGRRSARRDLASAAPETAALTGAMTAAMPAGLPPVPPAARHRRGSDSPGAVTATGVIRRIDPRLLPDQRDADW